MSNSNKERELQLGMPIGTATHRLRKKIMFRLLQKLQEDTCFKCNLKIENENDLSIEHKIPWLHISSNLFWDLDNIAFSHLKCNKPDRFYYGPSKLRKLGPSGTSWCAGHKKFMPKEQFSHNKSRWDNLSSYCNKCKLERK